MRIFKRSALALAMAFGGVCGSDVRAAAPAAAPAPKPAVTPPVKPGASPLAPGIAALLKEHQASLKDKAGAGLREKCDFYTTNKPDGVTPEVILAALEKPVSTDPRADAYAKWQLLSGLEGKFPDALTARAIKVYRAAPQPKAHPGLAHGDLERALNRVGVMKQANEDPVNKDFAKVIDAYRANIEPVLSYRDELYARLAPGHDAIVAGLADVYDRVSRGAPANEFWSSVSASIKSWALTAGDAGQMRQMAGALVKLRGVVQDEKNRPYYKVIYTNSDSYTGLKWANEGAIVNDKTIEDVSDFLAEQAKNPGAAGGIKIKDEGPKKK